VLSLAAAAGAWWAYRMLAGGAITIDLGAGRRFRGLGPVTWEIAAPRELVFDVISSPYLGPTPRALASKLDVWERSSEMVLAAHFTEVRGRTTTTVETVRFDRPARIDFRLVRGPVPHVMESFVLTETEAGTSLTWKGQLGTDLWAVGAWWGDRVATAWEKAVRTSLQAVSAEAERRA
jgi:Polyketide cyclase / dehydrase and lipid transport